jgi:cytochrome c553
MRRSAALMCVIIAALGTLATSELALSAGRVTGQDIVERGSPSGAPACISCHGSDLRGISSIKAPSIAGRPAAYILARLAHYGSPNGHNVMMKQVANILSDSDKQMVATYIAHLPITSNRSGN